MEFDIPLKLTDLETPQREGALGPKAHVDVAGMSDAEANDLVEQTAYDLCENDALCVLEQDVFDRAYACARALLDARFSLASRVPRSSTPSVDPTP